MKILSALFSAARNLLCNSFLYVSQFEIKLSSHYYILEVDVPSICMAPVLKSALTACCSKFPEYHYPYGYRRRCNFIHKHFEQANSSVICDGTQPFWLLQAKAARSKSTVILLLQQMLSDLEQKAFYVFIILRSDPGLQIDQ